MKKITIDKAYRILENAAAVIVDDNVLVYPFLHQLTDDDNNVFLYLSWLDEQDNIDFSLKFTQGDNPTVCVEGSSMFLFDTHAVSNHDHTQITVLVPKKLA